MPEEDDEEQAMITTDAAISHLRRDLALGTVLKVVLGGTAAACLLLGRFVQIGPVDPSIILAVIAGVWIVLSYQSLKGSRLAAGSSVLIASGQFEQAEQHLGQALRTFSVFRTAKLLAVHHLALLRHAQRRWQDAAALTRALLGQRLGPLHHLSKPSRLILADALLEMGDLRGAQEAIAGLYQYRLNLGEALHLLAVQLDQQHRTQAWGPMLDGLPAKAQLAELMPSDKAARSQALLALAAQKVGRAELSQWLRRRVELLADVQELAAARPALWALWEAKGEERKPGE